MYMFVYGHRFLSPDVEIRKQREGVASLCCAGARLLPSGLAAGVFTP